MLDHATAGGHMGGTGSRGEHLRRDGAPCAQKNQLKPWQKKHWGLSQLTADFFWRMEDILDRYATPYDPKRPVVCFNERPLQLVAHVPEPWPGASGRSRREDAEYRRQGTCNLFLVFEPVQG